MMTMMMIMMIKLEYADDLKWKDIIFTCNLTFN